MHEKEISIVLSHYNWLIDLLEHLDYLKKCGSKKKKKKEKKCGREIVFLKTAMGPLYINLAEDVVLRKKL